MINTKRYTYADAERDTRGSLEVEAMSPKERHHFLLEKVKQENFLRSHCNVAPYRGYFPYMGQPYVSSRPVRQLI
nr:MAG TPA: hypothetical protein [Caudoviricetes sp.]